MLVADDAEGRAIELRGHTVAPVHQLPEHGELAARQVARAFHAKERVVRAAVGPRGSLEQRKLLARPVEPSGPLELALQLVAQLEQVDRVLRGVVEHPLRQRPHRPVGALVLLVELHAEVPLEQRGEAERAEAQKLRRDARVEDVADVPLVVLLEQTQIVVGVVKDDLDPRILEYAAERRRLPDGYGIDDGRAFAGRELQQVDSIDESMEAGALGVQRDASRFD